MRRGFTLIEMLVVVSIIALLFAILLPMLTRTREATRRTVCAVNQKQIADGHIAYALDNDGYLAEAYIGKSNKNIMPHYFRDFLWDYLRDEQTFIAAELYCPSSYSNGKPVPIPSEGAELPFASGNGSWYAGYRSGYAHLNNMVGMSPSWTDPKPAVPTSATALDDAGRKHLVGELNFSWQANASAGNQAYAHPTTIGATTLPEGGNRGYLDGSVEWVDRREMGRNDTPLEPTSSWKWGGVERYDHWTPGDRRYYW